MYDNDVNQKHIFRIDRIYKRRKSVDVLIRLISVIGFYLYTTAQRTLLVV